MSTVLDAAPFYDQVVARDGACVLCGAYQPLVLPGLFNDVAVNFVAVRANCAAFLEGKRPAPRCTTIRLSNKPVWRIALISAAVSAGLTVTAGVSAAAFFWPDWLKGVIGLYRPIATMTAVTVFLLLALLTRPAC